MGGGMDFGGEDNEMDEMPSTKPSTTQSSSQPKKPDAKADPRANLTPAQRKAEEEKDLGNECYKKKTLKMPSFIMRKPPRSIQLTSHTRQINCVLRAESSRQMH